VDDDAVELMVHMRDFLLAMGDPCLPQRCAHGGEISRSRQAFFACGCVGEVATSLVAIQDTVRLRAKSLRAVALARDERGIAAVQALIGTNKEL